jgi:hypothetical protein
MEWCLWIQYVLLCEDRFETCRAERDNELGPGTEGVAEYPISTREHRPVTRPHYTHNRLTPIIAMIHRSLTRCPRRVPCIQAITRRAFSLSYVNVNDTTREPNSSESPKPWNARTTVVRLASLKHRRDICLISFSYLNDRPPKDGFRTPKWKMGC